MPEGRDAGQLINKLEHLICAGEAGAFNLIEDIGGLPPGEQDAVRLFNRMLNGARDGFREESGQLDMLTSILNGMDALITVCEFNTFEVLFLNDSIRANFGIEGDGQGQLCYKILQGRNEPCELCPYVILQQDPGKVLTWERRDYVNGHVLHKTARSITWTGGKIAHLEYAIDITELKNVQEALERREKMLDVLNSAALILLKREELSFPAAMSEGIDLITGIANMDRMSIFRNSVRPDGLYLTQLYRWQKQIGSIMPVREDLTDTAYASLVPQWESILLKDQNICGLVRDMPEASMLSQFGCVSLLVVPVFNDGKFWGIVLYEKLTEEIFNGYETDVLRSAGFMLANAVIRNEDAKKIRAADKKLKQMMRDIEHQNHLLMAVNSMSAVLLQSNAATFEDDIMRSMGIIAEAARADRVYVWENYAVGGKLYCQQTYEWSGGAEPQQDLDWVHAVAYFDVASNWEKAFVQKSGINGIVREMPGRVRNMLTQQEIVSILVIPIHLKEQFWGFIGFDDCHTERVFSGNEEKTLRSASELIANAIIRHKMEKNIRKLEIEVDKIFYDPLTGIYNRRFFDETIKRQIRSLARSGGVLSFMMIDIDYFKNYNDAYGHVEGDNCLKVVAQALQRSVTRADDFVARYGGEEFAVVLPNTDATGARKIARKLIDNVRRCHIPHEMNDAASCVTISVGVTTGQTEHTHDSQTYIQRADELLYESKQAGRNRFTYAEL